MTDHSVAKTRRKESMPRGMESMLWMGTKQIRNALRKERIGKSKSTQHACIGGKGIRAISRLIRMSHSTVHGWLVRMKDTNPERRFDYRHPGQKRKLDRRVEATINKWLGDSAFARVQGGGAESWYGNSQDTAVWHQRANPVR